MNLYHYCSNKKCFSILESKTLRMSDVAKSNDYSELELFYPQILSELRMEYINSPFPIKYKEFYKNAAFDYLLDETYDYWNYRFSSGDFSNLMVCFSSVKDSLSQWRGYSDNGRGCCLTFSKAAIARYCENTQGLLRFEKITYLSDSQVDNLVKKEARLLYNSLKAFSIQDTSTTLDPPDKDADAFLANHLDNLLEEFFIDSLKYKSKSFCEEDEWRIFMTHSIKRHRQLIMSDKKLNHQMQNAESKNEVYRDICFQITDDDIIPYYSIELVELGNRGFRGIILGPKNHIRRKDIELYLQQHGYNKIEIQRSQITYR